MRLFSFGDGQSQWDVSERAVWHFQVLNLKQRNELFPSLYFLSEEDMDCVHSSDPAPSIQMKMTPKGTVVQRNGRDQRPQMIFEAEGLPTLWTSNLRSSWKQKWTSMLSKSLCSSISWFSQHSYHPARQLSPWTRARVVSVTTTTVTWLGHKS